MANNRGLNSDPLRNFRYQVKINHPNIATLPRMGFLAVSGLGVTNEVIAYREGGDNTTTRKMPGQSEFGPITLTRGLMAAPVGVLASSNIGTNELYQWFSQIFAVNVGKGFGSKDIDFRVGVTIDVMGFPVTTTGFSAGTDNPPYIKARFLVYNCWPMGYSFSDLEAGGNAVIIETLTLAHEGWALLTAKQDTSSYLNTSSKV